MPSVSLNLLDPNLGIQNVMDSGSGARMPDARPLASTVLREAGLDELYQQGAAEKQLDAALCLRWETAPSSSRKSFRPNSGAAWRR